MKRLKTRVISLSLLSAMISFVALLYLLPYERFLDLALAIAFGVAFAGVVKYGRDAIHSLRNASSGASFLIVSVFAIFVILLGQRTWGIVLRVLDRPDWLVSSPITLAVPWFLAWALSLALIAPDIDLEDEHSKSGVWKSAALFIGGALAGFVIAASFGVKDSVELSRYSAWPHLANRPNCPKESVWVSSRGVYHTAQSPYRGSVVPRYCFSSVEKAEEAGFRASK
jgi:hypothetical protein